ncbi:MAG TPA: NUMOD4 motif-containing HNH endonuclease [Ohtaekwangia sp.]
MTLSAQETENEVWLPLPSNVKYAVSNFGRVKSVFRNLVVNDPLYNRVYSTTRQEKILKPNPNYRGYFRVDLRSTDRKSGMVSLVHRLIAEAFLPNPYNHPQVNHKDGDKQNNRVENLEWCTNLHNNRHARKNGLYPDLSNPNNFTANKLDPTQVRTIRKCLSDGMKYADLATYFQVQRSCIKDIKLKRTWVNLH